MALNNAVVFFLLIAFSGLVPEPAYATRVLTVPEPGHELARRLDESGGMMECWNALMELRSCSNEIILFFLNGQTDIGPGCCKAITIITRHCWSSMLTSLGFTAEEGNILRGYCDAAAASSSSPVSPVSSPPPVAAAAAPALPVVPMK